MVTNRNLAAASGVLRATLAFLLQISILTTAASAYREDHGFLPAGGSTCDLHVPVTLTVPANAAAVPDPFAGEYSHGFYHVEEVRDHLFYATDGVYQMMFLVASQGIIVVDAPPSIGFNPLDPATSVSLVDVIFSIPETQGKPIRYLVYSHSHLDHIAAASQITDAFPYVEIVAHERTFKHLKRGTGVEGSFLGGNSGTLPPPLPDRTFRKHTRVRLGAQRLNLSYRGPIHEPGNIFILAPRQRVLMLVDVIFPGWSPFNDLALAKDVPLYLEAHDEVLGFDFDTFIGGHLNRLGTRADVEESRLYMADIKANARQALSNPVLGAIFGIVPQNPLGAFGVFLDQVSCACANLTLDPATTPSGVDWLARLGAADRNTVGHCFEVAEALRIDSGF